MRLKSVHHLPDGTQRKWLKLMTKEKVKALPMELSKKYNYMKKRNYHCREGKVYWRDRPVIVREEQDMFRFAGMVYQRPEDRHAKRIFHFG